MKKRLLAAFLSLVMVVSLLPTAALATENEAAELDISNGSIIITETGYSQGTLVYDESSGYLVQGEDEQTVTETEWGDSNTNHALTITGESTSATILIMGGSPIVTLNNLTINQSGNRVPGLVLVSGNGSEPQNTATIVLEGTNTFASKDQVPGVQINKDATLTIRGSGTLYASSTNNTAGIGASRVNNYVIDPTTKLQASGHTYKSGGNLVIESGTINATGAGNSGAIGTSYTFAFGSIEVRGGEIVTSGSNYGLKADDVTISGGTIVASKSPGIDATTVSITGGNIGDAYNGTIEGRTLTKLAFFDEYGTPMGNTQVTVTEGSGDDAQTWTALTDSEGMVTTYLDDETDSVSVAIGTDEAETVTISDGLGVVGAECTCDENPGTLTMTTPSQGLTVTNGTATLELEAVYAKGSCVMPDGFHGAYEDISYEITQVVKNGQLMTVSRYASIEDNILTVYDETNADSYTVYVRAKCGPSGSEVYSSEIAVSVGTYVPVEPSEDENIFDIGLGDIVITAGTDTNSGKTVYTQGDKTVIVSTGTEVTITGTSVTSGANSTASMIIVKGGNPTMVLDNVTVTKGVADSGEPVILLYGAANETDTAATATIKLEGQNSLTGGSSAPAIQINKDATLTIQRDGNLDTAVSGGENVTSIGVGNAAQWAYAWNDGSEMTHNNYRGGGNLVIEGGTVSAMGTGRGTDQYTAGIGTGYYSNFGSVTIKGGTVIPQNVTNGCGIAAEKVTIEGGVIQDQTSGTKSGVYAGEEFSMSGGTLTGSGALRLGEGATVSITGGNVNSYYAEEIQDCTLTKLYFVGEDGTPKAETEVTVTEGSAPNANTWTAYTDENGVVTTYFASGTTTIKADVGSTASTDVTLSNGQALVGGTCSCTDFSGIAWNSGLPETVTLYQDEQTITVADAELVTDTPCNMPIHPGLPSIT